MIAVALGMSAGAERWLPRSDSQEVDGDWVERRDGKFAFRRSLDAVATDHGPFAEQTFAADEILRQPDLLDLISYSTTCIGSTCAN
jgi:hypothetical protein